MGKSYLINRSEIIQKRQALIREGLKPAWISGTSAYRLKERINVNKILPKVETTTYKSRLVSGVYQNVFCKGLKHEKDHA